MILIQLNSFVHRAHNKDEVIAVVNAAGGILKRIRRSRHWLLSATEDQLLVIHSQLINEYDLWIKRAIENGRPVIEPVSASLDDLVFLITDKPNITINQLVEESGCTLAEARIAMDRVEDLD